MFEIACAGIRVSLRRCLRALAVAGLLMGAGAGHDAEASLITFNFQGTVTFVDPALVLHGFFNTTQSISGSYTFDSTTPDISPADSTFGEYIGALTALTFTVGGYTGTLDGGAQGILVRDDFLTGLGLLDGYEVDVAPFSGAPLGNFLFLPRNFLWGLSDPTHSAFSNDLLPTTPPDLSRFDFNEFVITFQGGLCPITLGCEVLGTITTLTPAAVPEPSTLALLGAGLAGLAGLAWRRGRRK